MSTLRVLSDDPATVNYGRTVLVIDEGRDSILKFKIIKAWLVRHTIRSEDVKTDIAKVLNDYQYKIETTLVKHGPFHLYCAERFMPRGGKVQHGEAIAMMLAMNVHVLQGTTSKLIPAVSWKTQIKRYFDLDQLYKTIKPCPDHLLDAVFIGLYAAYTHLGIKPYSTIRTKDIAYIIGRLHKIGLKIKKKELEARAFIRAEHKRLGTKPEPKKKRKAKKTKEKVLPAASGPTKKVKKPRTKKK
jgi:hypothetical protein